MVLSLGLWVVNYIALEGLFGPTLGKRLLGLRVVKTDGAAMDWLAAISRNVLRLVDGFVFYLLGAVLVWLSPHRQRLGDRVAHTVVVWRQPQVQPAG